MTLHKEREVNTYHNNDSDNDESENASVSTGAQLLTQLLPLVALLLGARKVPHEETHEDHADGIQHQGVVREALGPIGVLVGLAGGRVHSVTRAGARVVVRGAAHALEGGEQLRGDDAVDQDGGVAHGDEQLVGGGLLAGLGQLDNRHRVQHL